MHVVLVPPVKYVVVEPDIMTKYEFPVNPFGLVEVNNKFVEEEYT
jgi:hypothetical protein